MGQWPQVKADWSLAWRLLCHSPIQNNSLANKVIPLCDCSFYALHFKKIAAPMLPGIGSMPPRALSWMSGRKMDGHAQSLSDFKENLDMYLLMHFCYTGMGIVELAMLRLMDTLSLTTDPLC